MKKLEEQAERNSRLAAMGEMAARIAHEIRNPFFTTRDKGTGLGLAIVHTIIESHNGIIEVESKAGRERLLRFCCP